MTYQEQQKELVDKIITDLCGVPTYPEGLMPHTVFVEETDDNVEPVFNRYLITAIDKSNRTCILEHPVTQKQNIYNLSDIETDWLITFQNRCTELMIEKKSQGLRLSAKDDRNQVREQVKGCEFSCPISWFGEGDLVYLNENAIERIRNGVGDSAADYRKDMLLVVCSTDMESGTVKVRDIREDDIQEFPANCLCILLRKNQRRFLETTYMKGKPCFEPNRTNDDMDKAIQEKG